MKVFVWVRVVENVNVTALPDPTIVLVIVPAGCCAATAE